MPKVYIRADNPGRKRPEVITGPVTTPYKYKALHSDYPGTATTNKAMIGNSGMPPRWVKTHANSRIRVVRVGAIYPLETTTSAVANNAAPWKEPPLARSGPTALP